MVREGLETALLFYAAAQGATSTATPLLGICLGLAHPVLIGCGLYAGALRINLTTFFTCSGVLLIFVAAGIFKYGVHDFQEAGVLPGLNNLAFDITGVLDPTSWYGARSPGCSTSPPRRPCWRPSPGSPTSSRSWSLFLLAGPHGRPPGAGAAGASPALTPNTETSQHVAA